MGEQTANLGPTTPEHLQALQEGVVLALRPSFPFLLGLLRLCCCCCCYCCGCCCCRAGVALAVVVVGHALPEARPLPGSRRAGTRQDAAAAAAASRSDRGAAAATDVRADGRRQRSGRGGGGGGGGAREGHRCWGVLLILHHLVLVPVLPLFLAGVALALTRHRHHGTLLLLRVLVLSPFLRLRQKRSPSLSLLLLLLLLWGRKRHLPQPRPAQRKRSQGGQRRRDSIYAREGRGGVGVPREKAVVVGVVGVGHGRVERLQMRHGRCRRHGQRQERGTGRGRCVDWAA